jgi:branched-chain amino acid transport system substrate-binding protein
LSETEKPVNRRNFIKYAGAGIIAAAAIGGGYYYYTSTGERKTPDGKTITSPTVEPTETPKGEPIKIGCPLVLTGTYAYYGVEMGQGIEIAVDEINAKGGVLGRPVEVIIRDTELTPAVATRRVNELIEREKIDFIVGVLGSQVNFAINEVSKRAKIPFMVGNQTETTMHTKDVLSPYAAFPMTVNQTAAYANIATTVDKIGSKHYVLTVDYVWGHEQEEMSKKALDKFGGEFIGNQRFPLGTTDFAGFLSKAREEHPDVLVIIAGGSDQINCLKQAVEFGVNKEMGIMVPTTTTSIAYAAGGAQVFQDMYVGIDWYYKVGESNLPYAAKAKELNDRFVERYGRPGDAYSLGNYVGMMEICKAAERAGSTDPDKVKAELEGHNFEYHKGPETWRLCDRQAIQDWLVVKGLPPEKTTGEYDFFEIVDLRGKENPDEYIATCEELGY